MDGILIDILMDKREQRKTLKMERKMVSLQFGMKMVKRDMR